MPSLRQREFAFRSTSVAGIDGPGTAISDRGYNSPAEFIPVGQAIRRSRSNPATDAVALHSRAAIELEAKAREILWSLAQQTRREVLSNGIHVPKQLSRPGRLSLKLSR